MVLKLLLLKLFFIIDVKENKMASARVREFEPAMETRLKRALGRLGRRELQKLLRSLYGKQEETKPPTKKQLLTTFMSAYAKVSNCPP